MLKTMSSERKGFVSTSLMVFMILALILPIRDEGRLAAQERESDFTDLYSVEELRSRFNSDEGLVRLILLLSPT